MMLQNQLTCSPVRSLVFVANIFLNMNGNVSIQQTATIDSAPSCPADLIEINIVQISE